MKTKILKRLLLLFLLFISNVSFADDKQWFLVTDKEEVIEMSRVCSLVATDTEETFSILDSNGHILAKDVVRATFLLLETTNVENISAQDDMLESYVDNILTMFGVEGNIDIFSVNGSKMLSVKAIKNQTKINVSHLAPGIYLVKCGTQSFKFKKK